MKYIEYKEHRQHGTNDFPFAFYSVAPNHPRYNMFYHWHTQAEIVRVLSGSFTINLNGTIYHLQAGDAIFIASGCLHGGTPDNCCYECLVFDLESLLQNSQFAMPQIYSLLNHETVIRPLIPGDNYEAHQIIAAAFHQIAAKAEGYQLLVPGHLYLLFGYFFQHHHIQESPLSIVQKKRLRHLRIVLNYIQNHYSENLTLQDLADYAGMNCNYFCRFFKNITMMTPIEYLNFYRVECACEKLMYTNDSITQIALDCGFNDASYFIKVFKKYKQTTPSHYLKM